MEKSTLTSITSVSWRRSNEAMEENLWPLDGLVEKLGEQKRLVKKKGKHIKTRKRDNFASDKVLQF